MPDKDSKDGSGQKKSRAPVALGLDRVLPNSESAEKAVLGAILLNPAEAGSIIFGRLKEEDFYYARHSAIFRVMSAMQDSLHAVDPVTLAQRLHDEKLLEEVGGPAYLADLATGIPTLTNLEDYIRIVEEKCLLRRLIGTAARVIEDSFEEQDDVSRWVDETEKAFFDITAERSTQSAVHISAVINNAFEAIEQLYDAHGITGLSTGFRDLDRLTSGLHAGTVFVIAARPSMGKTSLAMNIAENVAIQGGQPVGIFSLEMSREELVKRMFCSCGRVSLAAMRDGFLRDREHAKLTTAATVLMKAPLYIDDTAGLTITQVRSRARRLKLQYDIKLLVIDYMQLMRAPSRRADSSRQVEIADISSGVKALAKELKIPVIVLSQLNRQPEQREEGKPKLSDLRESGSIEQDADVVGLLVRPEVYADSEEDRAEKRGKATLIIAKQRNGPTGDVDLTFIGEYTRFENASRVEDGDVPRQQGGGQ